MTKQETERIELEIARVKIARQYAKVPDHMEDLETMRECFEWTLNLEQKSPFRKIYGMCFDGNLGREGLLERRNQDRRK